MNRKQQDDNHDEPVEGEPIGELPEITCKGFGPPQPIDDEEEEG